MIYSWKRPQSVRCHVGGLEKKSDSFTFPPIKAFWFFLNSNGKWNVLYCVNMSNRSLPNLTELYPCQSQHTPSCLSSLQFLKPTTGLVL